MVQRSFGKALVTDKIKKTVLCSDIILFGFVLMFVAGAFTVPASAAIVEQERVSITNPELVSAFGSPLGNSISVDQQVQIAANVTNNQDIAQKMAYIVQIKDGDDLVVSIGWVVGVVLNPDQSFMQSVSWIPKEAGEYTAEVFAWEGFPQDNVALSEHEAIRISVS